MVYVEGMAFQLLFYIYVMYIFMHYGQKTKRTNEKKNRRKTPFKQTLYHCCRQSFSRNEFISSLLSLLFCVCFFFWSVHFSIWTWNWRMIHVPNMRLWLRNGKNRKKISCASIFSSECLMKILDAYSFWANNSQCDCMMLKMITWSNNWLNVKQCKHKHTTD